jgi:hypothetical protein
MATTKGLIRAMNKKGTRKTKKPAVAVKMPPPPDPSCCERCGALYTKQAWRRAGERSHALLQRVHWTVCPACKQAERGEYFGRVVVRGRFAAEHEDEIRRRIRNIEERARFTQPLRKVVAAEREGDVFEVYTTSQKLAHRIVHELKKLYKGKATYRWSPDDGCLYATWERDE